MNYALEPGPSAMYTDFSGIPEADIHHIETAADVMQPSKVMKVVAPEATEIDYNLTDLRDRAIEALPSARAPLSRRFMVCLLQTASGTVFTGTTFEAESSSNHRHQTGAHSIHAEMNALQKMHEADNREPINAIVMAGANQKLSKLAPCFECHEAIVGNYGWLKPDLVLIEPNTFSRAVVLGSDEQDQGYRDYSRQKYSLAAHKSKDQLVDSLAQHTPLVDSDQHRVADFTTTVREALIDVTETSQRHRIGMYLTASASGRGGTASVLMEKLGISYNNINLIVTAADTDRRRHGQSEWLVKKILHNTSRERAPILDVTVAGSLQQGMRNPDYYHNGMFVRIM